MTTVRSALGMNRAGPVAPLGHEFDSFLFAQVGEDEAGMPITVVTLLARSDLDPWQEAASLAGLAPVAAARKVASLLKALLDPSLPPETIESRATRLVAMLPSSTGAPTTIVQKILVSGGSSVHRQRANALFVVIYIASMLATQLILANIGATRTHAASTPPAASTPAQTAVLASATPPTYTTAKAQGIQLFRI